jgi:RNA polymerase sigma-70 factor (ECF subfamily)
VTALIGYAEYSVNDSLRNTFAVVIQQAARWLYAVTGSPRAAEIGGVPTEDLIARFQKGQPRAFEALYDRYKDYVYRVSFFVLRNQQEAEDAVQETFLDLLKALPNYDIHGSARFETWLYRVTVNRSRMRLRRKSIPSEEWDDVEERLERLPIFSEEQPEQVILTRDRAAQLWHAVDSLPDTHRIPVLLRYQENLSYEEIANIIGISIGTVKSRLYNAHAKLKRLIGKDVIM